MTRPRFAARAAVLAALSVVLLSSCGSSEPEISGPELFREYTRSTDVENDKFPTDDGRSSEDRLANFAAYYTPEQLQYALLAATPCDDTATEPPCSPNASVRQAAKDFAGASGTLYQRSVLVKREDKSLELVTLYVARSADKKTALIDSDGATYTGGLDDFRRHNDIFDVDDTILTPQGIDSVPGEGKIVAVSGHTPVNWVPWVVGGAAVVVLPVAGVAAGRRLAPRRRIRTRRSPQSPAA
ncbi:hypothetical protein SSP24_78440 [Streptomyces spinoverrucosus]|uniref:Lipoprotein n=1 Tax=Streptomyces spinoverrucosus TaxID=284043 RepID=A0A4Y3VWV6_9ACTN|nr:hypothetical protein [Streptomyces spinoverrucosus]GEC10189.1 hypothetical protein SSP24_78440 [Streptomyces spinoverrucosus]GHB76606.1 hypothetical protein GCM10010397_53950 [Streptomyces spinoverrucosus]